MRRGKKKEERRKKLWEEKEEGGEGYLSGKERLRHAMFHIQHSYNAVVWS